MSLVAASRDVTGHLRAGASPPVPSRLGKYRVLLQLGRGGMATVYLAVTESAPGVSKLVVLKALLPDFAAEPEARAMFLDEARLAAQLNHGNVVQTYEVGEEQGHQVIVMEYLEGQSLAAVLKRARKCERPLPLALHLRLLLHVLDGLHYTHELRGYDGAPLCPVHRDVSPQNVFVTYDGRAKLLDFGIAKAASSTTQTATGLIKGKIAYMSPEQMAGEAVDRRADVYAVGCMLWAAAAGSKLWKDRTDVSILHDVVHDAVPSPRAENPDCDPELERIVMKALAKADARYGSALELHEDLERFCEAKGFPDRPRQLARFMAELFEQDRAELRARIETRLSREQSGVAFSAAESPSEDATLNDRFRALTSETGTMSASTSNTATAKGSASWGRWPWAASAAVAAGFLAFLVLGRSPAPAVSVSSSASSPVIARDSPPPNIRVTFASKPAQAQLFLDDQPIAGNPALQVLPRDGVVHRVRAELAGFRPASAEVAATGDQELTLNLEEIVPEQKPAKRATPTKVPPSAPRKPTTQSHAARAAACAQPFYVGPDGIKKIKPACL